jgi:hypothetical protein
LEHEIQITVAEHGRDAENGDRLLGTFRATDPATEVVIDQNVATGHLTATFIVDDSDARTAFDRGAELFATAMVDAGLGATRVLAVSASLVESEAQAPDDELVPA